jgi:uncharacterized membrane protein YoaK (UPF0700 family)
MKPRIILLAVYFVLANFIIYLTAGDGDRISAPLVSLYSWAFILIRRYALGIISALVVFVSYLLFLLVLTTFLSHQKNIRGPILPISFHVMGSIMASLSYGPLDANESPGLFVFYLILFLSVASLYLIVGWRLSRAKSNS